MENTHSFVRGVDQDDLVVFVHTVLVDPVRVQNTEVTTLASNTLLGSRTERSLELEVVDTLTNGFTESGTYPSSEKEKKKIPKNDWYPSSSITE